MEDGFSGTGGAAQKNWSHYDREMPLDMVFNHGHVVSISVYTVLMVVSAIGNCTVLSLLIKRRRSGRASRLDYLLIHLAIADLLVTFLMMPLEIAWAATVSWRAGDAMCRIMMFSRTFGLYLSSFVLVCISFDRYYAVLKPLCISGERRTRLGLAGAWIGATIASIPQCIIFHVSEHPEVKGYFQCVTYGYVESDTYQLIYFVINMLLMYLLPLCSTIFCYTAILLEIRRANTMNGRVRRNGVGMLGRARTRTFKMSVTILLVFFACWSPYYFYGIWYVLDDEIAKQHDPAIKKAMFLFSCTNSCANPIVYGLFNIRSDKPCPGRRGSSNYVKRGSRLQYTESVEISATTLTNKPKANINKTDVTYA